MPTIWIYNARINFSKGLWEQSAAAENATPKYNCQLILDRETIVKDESRQRVLAIEDVVQAAAAETWQAKAAVMLAKLDRKSIALRDGDLYTDDEGAVRNGYAGNRYLVARTTRPPTVVDRARQVVTKASGVIYDGCRVVAKVTIAANGKKGQEAIYAVLAGVQKYGDDERLGGVGAVARADEFEEYESPEAMLDDLVG